MLTIEDLKGLSELTDDLKENMWAGYLKNFLNKRISLNDLGIGSDIRHELNYFIMKMLDARVKGSHRIVMRCCELLLKQVGIIPDETERAMAKYDDMFPGKKDTNSQDPDASFKGPKNGSKDAQMKAAGKKAEQPPLGEKRKYPVKGIED